MNALSLMGKWPPGVGTPGWKVPNGKPLIPVGPGKGGFPRLEGNSFIIPPLKDSPPLWIGTNFQGEKGFFEPNGTWPPQFGLRLEFPQRGGKIKIPALGKS